MGVADIAVDAAGVRTHARAAGRGGTPLVLLHGAEADAAMWDPYMGELGRHRRVYALDLPGAGASEPGPDADCSPAGLAAWVGGFLDSQGHERCDLMGHSLGGSVALRVAVLAPSRVRRLVAVSPAHLAEAVPAFAEAADELLAAVVRGRASEGRVRALLGRAYAKAPDDPAIVEGARFWLRPGVRAFLRQGGREAARPIPPEVLASIRAPTMVVWGARDRFFPVDSARERAAIIPGSRLVVIGGAGHSPFEDKRRLFMLMVEGFLSGSGEG